MSDNYGSLLGLPKVVLWDNLGCPLSTLWFSARRNLQKQNSRARLWCHRIHPKTCDVSSISAFGVARKKNAGCCSWYVELQLQDVAFHHRKLVSGGIIQSPRINEGMNKQGSKTLRRRGQLCSLALLCCSWTTAHSIASAISMCLTGTCSNSNLYGASRTLYKLMGRSVFVCAVGPQVSGLSRSLHRIILRLCHPRHTAIFSDRGYTFWYV